MEQKKQLQVSAIENGTVIDHIPAKSLFKVISILGLDKIETPITFGTNLESHRLGSKAIIKISDIFFEDEDISKIALVAPEAKLNIIRNYSVAEKKVIEVPNEIKGIVKCINPKCITNHEDIVTKFQVVSKKDVTLRCHYCEKMMDQEHIKIV
jgi:aspartate carbamoyltransferase regulatory subunit